MPYLSRSHLFILAEAACFLMTRLLSASQPDATDLHEQKRQEIVRQLSAKCTVLFDQPYCPGAEPTAATAAHQTLDLFVPEGDGPFPLILWIHGGGWNSGNKDLGSAVLFVKAGVAFASIDYRLIKDNAPFPAQIQDCMAALAWLRQNALHYRIAQSKIGVMGHSAGAHLAGLLAVIGGTPAFSANQSVTPRVQAAVLWSGPFDLGREHGQWPQDTFPWKPSDPFCRLFFPGGAYDETFAKWASASTYVTKDAPPMLIVHGQKDNVVPIGQAAAFAESLKQLGVPITFRIEPESNHNTVTAQNFQEAIEFFKSTLH